MSITLSDLNNLQPKTQNLSSLMKTFTINFSYISVIPALKSITPDFKLITKNNEYQLHLEIVAAVSDVVRQALAENPELSEYKYNGDDSNFDQIAAFLNGECIKVNGDNINYIKNVAEDLKFTIKFSSELSIKRLARRFNSVLPYIPKKTTIVTKKGTFQVNKLIFRILNPSFDEKTNTVHISSSLNEITDIVDYLNGESLNITYDNFVGLQKIVKKLQLTSLYDLFVAVSKNYECILPLVTIINLQDTLLSIDERNVESIHSLIADSDFYKNSERHHDLIQSLEVTFLVRPRYFKSVIELISMFNNESVDFHKSLLKYIEMMSGITAISIPFVRQLFDTKIIDFEFIKKIYHIEHYHRNGYEYTFSSSLGIFENKMKIYFAPELKADNPEEFEKSLKNKSQYYYTSTKTSDILKFEEDGWFEFHQAVSLGHRPDDITTAIFNDNVDALQSITSAQPDFDFDKKYSNYLLEMNKTLTNDNQNPISYAEMAAFYGSVRCFKFLMLQNADLTKCPSYAIAGGNYEIVRILEQKGCSFKNMFANAIEYHRYDIFKWLTVNYGPIDNIYHTENMIRIFKPLLPLAITSFNHRALIGFFEYGIDHSRLTDLQLIGYATHLFNLHALKLLLKMSDTDPNVICLKASESPLYHAASFNYLEYVKALVNVGKCQLCENSQYNPLKEAAKRGNLEVVEFLAPLYKDFINDDYLRNTSNEIKEILLKAKGSQ